MIADLEYAAAVADIMDMGKRYDFSLSMQLGELNKQKAIKLAKDSANQYYDEYNDLLQNSLTEAASTMADYYNADIDVPDIVKGSMKEKYYGLSVAARNTVNKIRLKRNIDAIAAIGKDNLGGIYTSPFYGAQVNIDKRTLLAQMQKLEQDIAKKVASDKGILIRWNLSSGHSKACLCEELVGLYKPDALPRPPHPNCRCNFTLEDSGEAKTTPSRGLNKIRDLIRRIRS